MDYASVPSLNASDCCPDSKLDKIEACKGKINGLALDYMLVVGKGFGAHLVPDIGGAALTHIARKAGTLALVGPGGVVVYAVFAADVIANMGCTIIAGERIGKESEKAKAKKCTCP